MENLWPQRWTDLSTRKHQLKLRPMDDITHEEAKEILQIRTGTDLTDLRIIAQVFSDETPELNYIAITAYDQDNNAIEQTIYTPDPNQLFTPQEVVFFINKKIDIFGYNQIGLTEEIRIRKGDLN